MKIKKEIRVCDSCNTELIENDNFILKSYFSQDNIDLCSICLLKIINANNIKIENLVEKIKKLKSTGNIQLY